MSLSPTERLRAAGLRVTRPRLAVLDALSEGAHMDAETVARLARARLGTLSTQAVYDILRAFAEAGLVRRIEPAGSPARYETRVGDNHHHIVCRVCGATADVDCAVGERPCLDPSSTHGYAVDEAEVTFWGLCPACQQQQLSGPMPEREETHEESPSNGAGFEAGIEAGVEPWTVADTGAPHQ